MFTNIGTIIITIIKIIIIITIITIITIHIIVTGVANTAITVTIIILYYYTETDSFYKQTQKFTSDLLSAHGDGRVKALPVRELNEGGSFGMSRAHVLDDGDAQDVAAVEEGLAQLVLRRWVVDVADVNWERVVVVLVGGRAGVGLA